MFVCRIRNRLIRAMAVGLALTSTPATARAACPPDSYARADLLALKARDFQVDDDEMRASLALALLDCLEDPDPALRDGVAFEALSTWMRNDLLSSATAGRILDRLLPHIAPEYPDSRGFTRPFAALALAEVARMDRLTPFLTDAQLDGMVAASVRYLPSVDDYRGFDERDGWRHGVAHGADLLLQLSLNARVGEEGLERILSALASQVAPRREHFYVYGEPERLARVVYYAASRGLRSEADWTRWLGDLTQPAPLADWSEAFQSEAGLAKRHNTAAFLTALYLLVREGDDDFSELLLPGLQEAVRRVP
ncbi:MAG: DUF2785 domain-containing protein [Gemmatimonadota bacterium]|jgi:hypothetical protein